MGWSSNDIYYFGSIKKHMEQYSWENEGAKTTLLDYAIVNRKTVYGAMETTDKQTGTRRVWALVILFTFSRKEYAWKDLDETCGPGESNCPEKILKLLTPTDSEYANAWRKRCWDHIALSKFEMREGLVLRKKGQPAIILDSKVNNNKQYWWGHREDSSRSFNVTKRWLTLHGYTTDELLFDILL